ncbi:hypothetical protein BGX38DRAFT_1148625 [Terfezia claveryi]|nr:hypothetical protein BGX38DRAFT_1148625 [Terfezia claveryi]
MRSLKKRVGHKNPNIQLAALRLTDTCVKNGGPHFLVEIASREFMDNLVSLINAPGACTPEVKAKMLEVIQTWATAFEGMSQLSYVQDVYNRLRNEGHDFPPLTRITSSFVDSSAPPEWADSDVCMRCRTAFSFMNRKHHCRNCGNVFCGSCSSKNLPLPDLGIVQPERVCDGCHIKLTEKKASVIKANTHRSHHGDAHKHHSSRNKPPAPSMQPRNARVEDDDDEDLKMALKMSLDEVKGAGRTGYISQSQLQAQQAQQAQQKPVTTTQTSTKPPAAKSQEEEEDEELKAAIAASLKDMEVQKAKSAWSNPTTASAAAARASATAPRPDHELSPVEAENINLFATLVDRLQSQPPGTILREPQIQELYESIGALRPKLARTFGDTMSKYEALCDLHAKLATVVRYYDKMLEERLQQTYSRHSISGLPPQGQQRPSPYPTLPPSGDVRGYYSRNAESRAPPPSTTAYKDYYTQHQSYDNMVGGIPPPQQPQPSQPSQQKSQAPSTQKLYFNGYPKPQAVHQSPAPQQQPNQPPPPATDGPSSPQQSHRQPPPTAAGQPQQQPSQSPSTAPPAEQSYWQYLPQPKGQDGPGGYPYPYPPQQYLPQQPPTQWQQPPQQQQPGDRLHKGDMHIQGGRAGAPASQEAPPPQQQQQQKELLAKPGNRNQV